jgi:hypothetical protein
MVGRGELFSQTVEKFGYTYQFEIRTISDAVSSARMAAIKYDPHKKDTE